MDKTGIHVINICEQIGTETVRAIQLHNPMNSYHESYGVIVEELEEFWEQAKRNPKKLSHDDAEKRMQNMRKELIQLASMCVRTIVELVDENKAGA